MRGTWSFEHMPAFDVSPDGQRFLVLTDPVQGEAAKTGFEVILNWQEELKWRVPTR